MTKMVTKAEMLVRVYPSHPSPLRLFSVLVKGSARIFTLEFGAQKLVGLSLVDQGCHLFAFASWFCSCVLFARLHSLALALALACECLPF